MSCATPVDLGLFWRGPAERSREPEPPLIAALAADVEAIANATLSKTRSFAALRAHTAVVARDNPWPPTPDDVGVTTLRYAVGGNALFACVPKTVCARASTLDPSARGRRRLTPKRRGL